MNIVEYQAYVDNGASFKYDKKLAIIGLMGEVGELSDVIKKEAIYDDMSKFVEKYGMSVDEKIADEIGDCLWQLVLVACKYDLNIEDVINKNVEKLNSRHKGFNKVNPNGGGER